MEKPEIYDIIAKHTKQLANTVREEGKGKVTVNQIGSLMSIFFTEQEVVNYDTAVSSDTNAYAEYFAYMLEKGIYVAPSQFEAMFISAMHTQEEIVYTGRVIGEALHG